MGRIYYEEGNPLLKILQEHLFRIRNWTKGKENIFSLKMKSMNSKESASMCQDNFDMKPHSYIGWGSR
jgi:hypothetical protein